MNKEILKRDGFRNAAALARGDGLSVLFDLCKKQKTISTKIVLEHIERTSEFMKDSAVQMRKLTDAID